MQFLQYLVCTQVASKRLLSDRTHVGYVDDMKSVLSVTVVQESQRVTVSDSQTDSAENVDNSEQLQTPTAAQLHNETTTGNRFRHHVTSIVAGSACGCWSEQLERRLVRTVTSA